LHGGGQALNLEAFQGYESAKTRATMTTRHNNPEMVRNDHILKGRPCKKPS